MDNIPIALSDLKIEQLYFSNIVVDRESEIINNNIEISFSKKFDAESEKICKVEISCKLSNNVNFSMEIKLVGIFSLKGENNIDKYEKNIIAILFPYLRSQITLVTAQPGMSSINLPVMNINNMFND